MKVLPVALLLIVSICPALAQDRVEKRPEIRVALDHLHPDETSEAAIIVARSSRIRDVRILVAQSLYTLPRESPVKVELGARYSELVASLNLFPFYAFEEWGAGKPIAPGLIYVSPASETPTVGNHIIRQVSLAPMFCIERSTIWLLFVLPGKIDQPR